MVNTHRIQLANFLIIFAISLIIGGCSTWGGSKREFSGFLEESSKLEPVKIHNLTISWKWENPEFKERNYKKVYVEPVEIFPKPLENQRINSAVYKGIRAYLTDAVKREISKVANVVESVDESTVRMRSAITYADAPVGSGKPHEFVPIAMVIAGVKDEEAAKNNEINVYLEAELLDGVTNKRVVAGVRYGSGQEVKGDDQPITLPNVQPILDMWASDAKTFIIDTESVIKN